MNKVILILLTAIASCTTAKHQPAKTISVDVADIFFSEDTFIKSISISEDDKYQPPPEYIEIVKSLLTRKSLIDTIRGWEVTFDSVFAMNGDGAVYIWDVTSKEIKPSKYFLNMYIERISIHYGLRESIFSINIFIPKEEMGRRQFEINKKYK